MILERTKNEVLVRLPADVDLTELQNMIDYLEYKELTMYSKGNSSDVVDVSTKAKKNIWAKFKAQRGLK